MVDQARGEAPVAFLNEKPVFDDTIACTLEADARPDRAGEWQAMLARGTKRERLTDGGFRIAFGDDAPVAELATLVAAEQQCCTFFAFAITADMRGVALEVRAPADATELVATFFGFDE